MDAAAGRGCTVDGGEPKGCHIVGRIIEAGPDVDEQW
jgi:hypothetical protein